MKQHSFEHINQLFGEFSRITKYQDKIAFFDTHFELIPFKFELIDLDISWFKVLSKTGELIELFRREKDPSINYYEKRFTFGNNNVIVFDIKPGPSQHLVFNEYVFKKLTVSNEDIIALIEKEPGFTSNPLPLLEKKLASTLETINWVKETLETTTTPSIRFRFLNLFYNGYADFYKNDRLLKRKKKFIELYLYSQGLFFVNYKQILKDRIAILRKANTHEAVPFLKQKLILLQKLGVIDSLKRKFSADNNPQLTKQIAKAICILISNDADNYSVNNTSYKIIYEYLSTAKNNEPKNEKNNISEIIAQFLSNTK